MPLCTTKDSQLSVALTDVGSRRTFKVQSFSFGVISSGESFVQGLGSPPIVVVLRGYFIPFSDGGRGIIAEEDILPQLWVKSFHEPLY